MQGFLVPVWFVNAVVQATALLALAALAAWLLRSATAAARRLLWLCALALLPALPLLSWVPAPAPRLLPALPSMALSAPRAPVALPASGNVTREAIQAAFEISYRASFSRLLAGLPIRIAAMRVAAIGRRPRFDFTVFAPDTAASLAGAQTGTRPVWFEGGWRETGVWSRLSLPAGARLEGPAILEQPDSTIVVEPGFAARVDRLGNFIVEPV